MPTSNDIHTSWTRGEVSPLTVGRTDVNLYKQGAAQIENWIVRTQGALTTRPGLKHCIRQRGDHVHRLIPFINSDSVGYQLFFGDQYAWVLRDEEALINIQSGYGDSIAALAANGSNFQIQITATSVSISTVADNGSGLIRVTTSSRHGLRTGSKVKITGTGLVALDGNTFTATYVTTTSFDVASAFTAPAAAGSAASCYVRAGDPVIISGSVAAPTINGRWRVKSVDAFDTYTLAQCAYAAPGAGAKGTSYSWIVEFETGFDAADLAEIDYAQSADVMYLAHGDYAPTKILRKSNEEWQQVAIDFKDGPYLPINATSFFNPDAPAYGRSFPDVLLYTSSYTHTGTVYSPVAFVAGDVGKYIDVKDGDEFRLAKVTAQAGASATVQFIDNILMFMDDTIVLKSKAIVAPVVTGSAANAPNTSHGVVGTNPNTRPSAQPYRAQRRVEGRNGVHWDGANIQSQFSNTFSQVDIGKYVRVKTGAGAATAEWRQITGLVNAAAGAKVTAGAALTMAANNATGNFVVQSETRTARLNAFRGYVDLVGLSTAVNIFCTPDVGRKIRIGFAGRWTWGKITALYAAVSGISASVDVELYVDYPRDPKDASAIAGNQDSGALTTGITYDWRLGAWGDEVFSAPSYATHMHGAGYPKKVAIHKQRLVWGNTKWLPQTFWMSVVGDYENMLPSELDSTVLDDNAVAYTIAGGRASEIRWMTSAGLFVIGTAGSEWHIRASSQWTDPITPSNIDAYDHTAHGVADIKPVRVGKRILFIDKTTNRLRELEYEFASDSVKSDDLTAISEHIIRQRDGASSVAIQVDRDDIVWVAGDDGSVAALTYNREQEVFAWHRHSFPSSSIVYVNSSPSTDGKKDTIWMQVERTISGATMRCVEVLTPILDLESGQVNGICQVDGALVDTNGWEGDEIAGLDHLEGLSVTPVVGATPQAAKTVTGGKITMDDAGDGSDIAVGLAYNCDLLSLVLDGASVHGSGQGQIKRVIAADLRVDNTKALQVGPNFTSMVTETFGSDWTSTTTRVKAAHGYDHNSRLAIRQNVPLPATIACVILKVETNE